MSRVTGFPEGIVLAPCVVATNAAITLSGEQTVNGKAVVDGDRVIVKDQADATENGIYVVAAGAWTRATDMNESADMASNLLVMDVDNGELFELTYTGTYSPGTTEVTFANPSGGESSLYLKLDTANDQTIDGTGSVTFGASGSVTFKGTIASKVTLCKDGEQFKWGTTGGASAVWWQKRDSVIYLGDYLSTNSEIRWQGAIIEDLDFTDDGGVKIDHEGTGNIIFQTGIETQNSIGLRLPESTVSGLPSAATTYGLIYVTDAARSPSGTGTVAWSNGTNWIDITDQLPVHI